MASSDKGWRGCSPDWLCQQNPRRHMPTIMSHSKPPRQSTSPQRAPNRYLHTNSRRVNRREHVNTRPLSSIPAPRDANVWRVKLAGVVGPSTPRPVSPGRQFAGEALPTALEPTLGNGERLTTSPVSHPGCATPHRMQTQAGPRVRRGFLLSESAVREHYATETSFARAAIQSS